MSTSEQGKVPIDERLLGAVGNTESFMPKKDLGVFKRGGTLFDTLTQEYFDRNGALPRGSDADEILRQVEKKYPGFQRAVNTYNQVFQTLFNAPEG